MGRTIHQVQSGFEVRDSADGKPLSPVLSSLDDLRAWLIANGTQERKNPFYLFTEHPIYLFSLAAASFAVFIQNSAATDYWTARPVMSFLLSAAIPLCLGVGFVMRHNKIPIHPFLYAILSLGAVLIALTALTLFFLSISLFAAVGFVAGTATFILLLRGMCVSSARELSDVVISLENED